ncbi:histone methyltransferase set2 [Nowakowskiella sp. JEL0078]|nr:histone methyltransferase set2 [Nowakowskiella sp. JEL0078]
MGNPFLAKFDSLYLCPFKFRTKAQPCYCCETVCSGVIGGSKISDLRIGDDDFDDEEVTSRAWLDSRTGKKIDLLPGPMETIEDVQKVVKSMLRMSSKPSKAKQLLQRIEATESIAMQKKFLQYHGLVVLKQCLGFYITTEHGICAQVVQVLKSLPVASRNLVVETKVEEFVLKFREICEADAAAIVDEGFKEINSTSTHVKTDPIHESNSSKRSNSDPSDSTPLKRQQIERLTTAYRRNSNDRALQQKQISTCNLTHTPPMFQSFISSPTQDLDQQRTVASSASPYLDTLPKDWRSACADDGCTYYYNTQTHETSWDVPRFSAIITNLPPFVNDDNDDMACWSPSEEINERKVARKLRHAARKAKKLDAGSAKSQNLVRHKHRHHVSEDNNNSSNDYELVKEKRKRKISGDMVKHITSSGNHKSKRVNEKKNLKEDQKKVKSQSRIKDDKKNKLQGEKNSRLESDRNEIEKRKTDSYMRNNISQAVIKYLSRHKHSIDSDKFKKIARKITHALQERQAASASIPGGGDVDDNNNGGDTFKKRVKKYVLVALRKEGITIDIPGEANVGVGDNEVQDMTTSP